MEIISATTTVNKPIKMGRVVVFEYEYVVFSKSDEQHDTAVRQATESQFYMKNPDIVLWIWQTGM